MFLQYWEESYPLALLGERMVKEGRIEKAWYNVKADGHAAKVLEEAGARA